MDWTLLAVASLVGLAAGVLLALLIDNYFINQRHQLMLTRQESLQRDLNTQVAALHKSEKKLVRAQGQTARLDDALKTAQTSIETYVAQQGEWQQKLTEANAEIEVMHGNLNRVTDHTEKLQDELTLVCEKHETAVAENQQLETALEEAQTEIKALENENNAAMQEIAANDADIRNLQESLGQAQAALAQAKQLEQENQRLTLALAAAEKRLTDLKEQMTMVVERLTDSQALQEQVRQAEARLHEAELKVAALQLNLGSVKEQLEDVDNQQLQLINGIGATYARRLNEAGIHTLHDLAQQTPERLIEIVKLRSWQSQDPNDWIAEARQLTNSTDD